MAEASPQPASQNRRQFEVENELARRLNAASRAERRHLYGVVYDELFSQFPHLGQPAAERADETTLQYRLIERFLQTGQSFLEVGAGDAALARRVAEEGIRAVAIEASARALARAVPHPGLSTLTSEGPPYPFPDRSIDFAFSCHFVEHLHAEDLREHLAEMARLLVPGAPYVCVTPNLLLGPHDVSRSFSRVAAGLHLREYTYGALAGELRAAGFVGLRVLLGVGRPPVASPLLPVVLLETVIRALPRAWRGGLLASRWVGGRPEPLRVLEQVKILGRRARS